MTEWWLGFKHQFWLNFIDGNRWHYITDGLKVTLELTFGAVILGIVIGFIVAIIRTTHDNTGRLIVQLMIIYYFMLAPYRIPPVVCGIISFGINSGAYVAEIVRAGIMSIDKGQMEAGRSLGFNYLQTMVYIIAPQAFKNVLPALGNEFIVLLKETSVAGYISLMDLTKGGDIIRGRTLAVMPLLAVALIYLVMVMFMQNLLGRLERRLRQSDH